MVNDIYEKHRRSGGQGEFKQSVVRKIGQLSKIIIIEYNKMEEITKNSFIQNNRFADTI